MSTAHYLVEGLLGGCLLLLLYHRSRIVKAKQLSFYKSSYIHQITREILHFTPANRVLLIKAENGGPVKYGTVIIDEHDSKVSDVMRTFNRHKLDDAYLKMLSELMLNKKVVNITADMQDGDLLKRRYETDEITGSLVYFICEDERRSLFHSLRRMISRLGGPVYLFRRIYYLSISTVDPDLKMINQDKVFALVEGKAYAFSDAVKDAIHRGIIN